MQKVVSGKLLYLFPVLFIFLLSLSSFDHSAVEISYPENAFKEKLTEKSQELDSVLKEMMPLLGSKFGDPQHEKLKNLFLLSRNKYKEVETFIIHFFPGDALALNPPDLPYPEEDDEVSIMYLPHGFQVLERLIFADSSNTASTERKAELDFILKIVKRWPESISYLEFPQREIFETAQMGFIRVYLVGLTNIETPHCNNAFQEAIAYTSSLQEFLSAMYYKDSLWVDELQRELYPKFDELKKFVAEQEKNEVPDFFTLYSKYYIPASEVLGKVRHFVVPGNFFSTTAVNLEARSIFDPNSFNTYFFLPGKNLMNQKEVVDLGRILFFDPVLSQNNERACASCHNPKKAFTDGLQVSRSFQKQSLLDRNAPGLLNSVLQRKLFHDGRSFSFENQASEVLNNPDEMHPDFSKVASKLSSSTEYRNLFRKAFKETVDTTISARSILLAIAEYERSLVALNSRFDKTIRGFSNVLSKDEKHGFNIFIGKADCASCHFLPLFNGTVPPEYVETEMEVLGVPGNADLDHPIPDRDPGREAIIPMEMYRGAFKTPGLRNVELTAPYMHNGVFQTLEEVIEFYDRGGGVGIGLQVPNQTLLLDSLHLTSKEKNQLILFLKSLTDTVNTTEQPTRLPLFQDSPALNSRSIGGDY